MRNLIKKVWAKKNIALILLLPLLLTSCSLLGKKEGLISKEEIIKSAAKQLKEVTKSTSEFIERQRDEADSKYEKGEAVYQWSKNSSLKAYYAKYYDKEKDYQNWWFPGEAYQAVDDKIEQKSIEPRHYSLKEILALFDKLGSNLNVHQDPSRPYLYVLSFEKEALSPLTQNTAKGEISKDEQKLAKKGQKGDLSLDKLNNEAKLEIRSRLNDILAKPLGREELNKYASQVRFYFDKENLKLLGFELRFFDLENEDFEPRLLSLVFSENVANKIEKPSLSSDVSKRVEKSLAEDKKEEKEDIFTTIIRLKNESQEFFNTVNQYSTEEIQAYKVKDNNASVAGSLKTTGQEFYKDNSYLYFIGRVTRKLDNDNMIIFQARNKENTYEKALPSANKLAASLAEKEEEEKLKKMSEEEKKEYLKQKEENKKNKEDKDDKEKVKLSEEWQKTEALKTQFYQAFLNSLDMTKNLAKDISVTEKDNNLIFTLKFKGVVPEILDFISQGIDSNLSIYKELNLEGEFSFIYDRGQKIFSKFTAKMASVDNEVLDFATERTFKDFKNGEIIPWPIKE